MKEKLLLFIIIISSLLSFSQTQNISNGQVFDGEPYISIDPYNAQHLIVAWMSWELNYRISIKTKTSYNGGKSWSQANRIEHVISGYTSADPSIEFDHQGNIFLSFIDYTGYEADTLKGGIYTCKSIDGGLNWNEAVEVLNINSDPGKRPIDRPWISIDRSAGENQGNIYITSMNAKEANSAYHPYFMKSTDSGDSYHMWKYLDTTNWLAGNYITQPMPTNCVAADGSFHAIYPSYVFSQNPLAQFIIASSYDGGNSFSYQTVLSLSGVKDSLAKTGYLLRANPANAQHLAFFYFDNKFDDLDLFIRESYNQGISWTEETRINDDYTGAQRMQDLVWADFDIDGDLVIAWRDRRNGSDTTYSTSSEIWSSVRSKDSSTFSTNFRISDTLVAYDEILSYSGNDFMCIKMMDDTLNAVWGDTRNGKLNIWFQKMDLKGNISSTFQLSNENIPFVKIFPNPFTQTIHFEGDDIQQLVIYNEIGEFISKYDYLTHTNQLNLEYLKDGIYILQFTTNKGIISHKVFKQHTKE